MQADGNCMYHALAHQCQICHVEDIFKEVASVSRHQILRDKAAAYIEANSDQFLPFIVDANSQEPDLVQMSNYLKSVRGFAWGSQVELQALAAALKAEIQVSPLTGRFWSWE